MAAFDWSRFRLRIDVKAKLAAVYAQWSTPAALEHWFLRRASFHHSDGSLVAGNEQIAVNDTYTWFWHGYDDSVFETGTIMEADGFENIRFSFGKAGICHVSLESYNDRCIVSLEQYNIPADELSKQQFHIGCQQGWTFYLANLKSMTEGGIDLRNKDNSLQSVINS